MRDQYPGNVITDPLNNSALQFKTSIFPNLRDPIRRPDQQLFVPWDKYNYRTIPSVKIDHNFGTRSKLSGYWSNTRITANTMCDGFTDISPLRHASFRTSAR